METQQSQAFFIFLSAILLVKCRLETKIPLSGHLMTTEQSPSQVWTLHPLLRTIRYRWKLQKLSKSMALKGEKTFAECCVREAAGGGGHSQTFWRNKHWDTSGFALIRSRLQTWGEVRDYFSTFGMKCPICEILDCWVSFPTHQELMFCVWVGNETKQQNRCKVDLSGAGEHAIKQTAIADENPSGTNAHG